MSAPVDFIRYRGRVFRNIATLHPSQNLMDDLVDDAAAQAALGNFFYDSDVAPQLPAVERVFQKSFRHLIQEEIQAKFNPQNWYASRFSDGSWAVLYAAEAEETALSEIVFHLREFYREELESKTLNLDRKVLALQIKSEKALDLHALKGVDREGLLSQDRAGYPYCQALAKELIGKGAQLLKTPSARQAGGVCVPIFDTAVINRDYGHMKDLKLVLSRTHCSVYAPSRSFSF